MIDRGLLMAVKKAIATPTASYPDGHPHVQPEDMLAVIRKESGYVPTFAGNEPLFRGNLRTALGATGLREGDIRALITLPKEIDGWKVPVILAGRMAKWRLEPEWYKQAKFAASPVAAFYWASSWGMVQFMGFNIVKEPDERSIEKIIRFAADIPMQLLYCAGELEKLIRMTPDDRPLAYTRYNAGQGAARTWKAYREYGIVVDNYRQEIVQQLREMDHAT